MLHRFAQETADLSRHTLAERSHLCICFSMNCVQQVSGSLGHIKKTYIPKASFFRSMAGGVPSGATEGSSMGPGPHDSFFISEPPKVTTVTHFGTKTVSPGSRIFQDPFPEHFFMIFGPRNGPQNHPKMVPKSFHF